METLRTSTINAGDHATLPHRIVLRQRDHSVHPFVTHMEVLHRDLSHQGYCWGHYCGTLAEALDDFAQRCRETRVIPLTPEV